ncbi:Hypothetical protein, partial CDS, partial [Neorhizobium galegae bv. officinalis]
MLKFAPEAASLRPKRTLATFELPSDMNGKWNDTTYFHTIFHHDQPSK